MPKSISLERFRRVYLRDCERFYQSHDIMHSIDKYNELHINMTSRRYKSVSNRQQISLLPASIEDYVHETNPAR